MRKFNTRIEDKHFQEIHHALGCPWPEEIMGETYRNYFCAGAETAARMATSPHWTDGQVSNGSTYFFVTQEGREALKAYILQNLHVPARYAVIYRGHKDEPIFVPAKTRSGAKYRAYQYSECEWPLPEFMAEIKSVRIHTREINPHLAA